MKKFITIFSVFLFLSFNMNTITVFPTHKVSKQGFYTMKDLNLTPNTIYYIKNTSPNTSAIVFVFDSNQVTQQSIPLKPQSPKYPLVPLQYDYTITILGNAEIEIS